MVEYFEIIILSYRSLPYGIIGINKVREMDQHLIVQKKVKIFFGLFYLSFI